MIISFEIEKKNRQISFSSENERSVLTFFATPLSFFSSEKDLLKKLNPTAREFNPFASSAPFSRAGNVSFPFAPGLSGKSLLRRSPEPETYDVIPLGELPPELVRFAEHRSPSGLVYTVPKSNQTVEFWENVKNVPSGTINILKEMS